MAGVLTLGPAAAVWRRRLAPLAWCALEVLAERAHPASEVIVADVSVRSLAEELGVAKNTALRALATLRAAGLVAHCQGRDDAGRYDASTYQLILTADILASSHVVAQSRSAPQPHSTPDPKQGPNRVTQPSVVEQLVLLPVS